ncbi:MAG: acyl carrier protein [Bacteroidales bacterium]|nr:acyl carrier protein [Bacteroidales bacterium]
MNDKSEIIEKIKRYIVKSSFSQKDEIQNDTLIFEDSLLDSMGFLFLIDFLKEEFTVEIEDVDLVDENFKSINNITGFLLKKFEVDKLS